MKKLNNFLNKCDKLHGSKFDYSLVDYINNKTKVKIICPDHGEFEMTPSSHLRNKSGCPNCSPNTKSNRGTFISESKSKHGDIYDYSLVEYKNNRTHVEIICHNHDEPFKFKQTPYKHKSGQGCPLCAGKYSYGYKIFIRKAKKIHGDKYLYDHLEEDYIDNKTKVRIICPDHGIFTQSPNNHLMPRGCNKCVRREFNSKKDFIREAHIVHKNKYDYSKINFNSLSDRLTIICPDHGEFKQVAGNHINGSGCRKCAGCERYNQKSIIDKFKEVHGETYDYSKVIFEDIRSKVKIICKKHGEFEQEPFSHYYSGQGCPVCKSSKGEKKVSEVLDLLNINYKHQYKFEDCVGMKRSLPFDFYLPEHNTCIEYDGKQHFEINKFFGGEEGFRLLKENDNIKEEYCENNNIKMVRIPYFEYENIEDILKIELGFLIKLGNYKLTSKNDKNFHKIFKHFNNCKIGKVKCENKPNCYENDCHNNVSKYVSMYGGEKISGYYLITEIDTDIIYAIKHSIWKNPFGDILDITPCSDGRKLNIFLFSNSNKKDKYIKIC